MKDIERVFEKIASGYCTTAADVADETGISRGACAVHLNELKQAGMIRDTGRRIAREGCRDASNGFIVWEPVESAKQRDQQRAEQ